jgi:hypothetical protein
MVADYGFGLLFLAADFSLVTVSCGRLTSAFCCDLTSMPLRAVPALVIGLRWGRGLAL